MEDLRNSPCRDFMVVVSGHKNSVLRRKTDVLSLTEPFGLK